jgi:hypothetical protein
MQETSQKHHKNITKTSQKHQKTARGGIFHHEYNMYKTYPMPFVGQSGLRVFTSALLRTVPQNDKHTERSPLKFFDKSSVNFRCRGRDVNKAGLYRWHF